MTDFPGHTEADRFRSDIFGPYPGRSASLDYPPAQPPTRPDFRNVAALAIDSSVGSTFAAGPGPDLPAPSENDHSALTKEDVSIGGNWFEKVHIIPRTRPSPTFTPIDFGSIISTVQDTFEIFSAFRKRSVTMTTFVNNAGDGVEVPDLPVVPFDLGPFESLLNSASTRLNPLPIVVQVTPDGPATFNDSLDFTFNLGAGTLKLLVKGNRIALVVVEPTGSSRGGAAGAGGFAEILESVTDILPIQGGKEQRIAPRDQPRQIIEWDFLTETVERRLMQALIFDWQSRVFAVPLRWEQVKLTTAIVADTTTVALTEDLTFVDMRVGELAVIFKDRKTFDALEVVSKTATSITLESNIQNAYPVGTLVMPIRLCHAQPNITASRFPVTVESFKVRFRCTSNSINPPTPSTAAFSTYLGKVLLDDCNLLQGMNMGETLERRIFIVDNETGLVTQDSPWDHGKRKSVKGFLTKTRQQLFELRQLLYAINGRQVSFYLPTFIEDLDLSQDLVISTSTMDIDNIGYTRFIQSRPPKLTFRIKFTDGTSLIRVVQSSVELSADEERLTLDTTWPANRTISEVERIEFFELSRFDTDSLRIQHSTIIGRAKLFAPVTTVNDLD